MDLRSHLPGFSPGRCTCFLHTFHDESKARTICEDIQKMGGQASIIMNPLETPRDATRMLRQVIDTCGKLDILVNQAAQGAEAELDAAHPNEWMDEVETAVNTVFLSSQAAVWHMVDQKKAALLIYRHQAVSLVMAGFHMRHRILC